MRVFEGRKIVLLSKHKKEIAIKSLLESETGCQLIVESSFDTDQLGTFTRDIDRRMSQLETAREKNKICLELTDFDMAISSEGSFDINPLFQMPWNIEIVLLHDKKENYEVFGIFKGPETNLDHTITSKWTDAVKFAEKIGFPDHYIILRPGGENGKPIYKDIDSFAKFEDAFIKCKKKSLARKVFIETDMRAHANPTRMKNIMLATQDLVNKLNNLCPNCGAYGFVVTDVIKGLRCELCGLPSDLVLKYVYSCYKCKHNEEVIHPYGEFASPKYCYNCNP